MIAELAPRGQIIRGVREALHALQNDVDLAVDIETSGLSPWKDKVAVVSIYGDQSDSLAVLHVRGNIPPELKQFLEEPHRRHTYHNGVSFDLPFLMAHGVEADRARLYDTLTGATVVASGTRQSERVNLKAEVDKRLGITLAKSVDHGSWMDPELNEQQLKYCSDDISNIHALRRAQELEADRTGQTRHLELESAITGVTARMTHNGLPIGMDALDAWLEEQHTREVELITELHREFGHVNYGSHVQVKQLFHDLGVDLPTTEADFLQELAYDGPEGLLERREYQLKTGVRVSPRFQRAVEALGHTGAVDADTLIKYARVDQLRAEKVIETLERVVELRHALKRQQSYGPKFQANHIHDGVVHSRYWQVGADTGRFTSSDPNLQQVPKDGRWVFGHRPGWSIVSVDYSQIEFVIAAYLANDQVALDLCARGGDIHRAVAAQLFGVDEDQVTDKQRRVSKACSFTLIFAGGAKRLVSQARQNGAKITEPEGRELVKLFFSRFRGLAADRQRAYDMTQSGRRVVEVRLASGFRRLLVGSKLKPTTLLNTRVQGTAAIGLKMALLHASRAGLGMYLGAPVHDELVACVPTEWAQEYSDELSKCMIAGMRTWIDAPIRVEAKIGETWG